VLLHLCGFDTTGKGFSVEDKKASVPIIYNNMLTSMQALVRFSQELNPPCPIAPANQAAATTVANERYVVVF
jgi:hypothetical protein